jgi:hypothetical protein
MRRLLLLTAVLALVLAPAARAQDRLLGTAAQALAGDPVYVHPDASPKLTDAQAEELRQRITDKDAGPMYVAFLPASVVREGGGSVGGALSALQQQVGRPGTYVLVAGRTFRAGSTDLREGATAQAATDALKAHPGDIDAILLDLTDRIGDLRAGREPAGDSGGGSVPGFVPFAFLALVVGGIGLLVTTRTRKLRREQAQQFAEVHDSVRDDVIELGDEIRALDLDVQVPGMPEEAKADYETALGAYERASAAVDRARAPHELEPVGAAVEEGRYAMASARARLEGKQPPERTPPCFFDPRHGPSSREVEWSPPYGSPRMVPACEADAQRVDRGEDPDPRQITLGGRQVPYWNAGPAYAPYMGGFYGGGLLPGLFIGSMLGGWDGFGGGYSDTGSGSGFGDFGGGGGDFGGGGGDFGGGGGDFGGGDF